MNNKNYAIMKKNINLLTSIDEFGFIDIYIVIVKPYMNVRNIESIAFLNKEDAQKQCDYLNKKHNTDIFRVFTTCMKAL